MRLASWRDLPPPLRELEAIAVVPVRNEASRIGAALAALAAQRGLDGTRVAHERYEVLVLVNNSDDASAEIARRVARETPGFRLHVVDTTLGAAEANVGFVRRQLMDEAARRLAAAGAAPTAAICSTDGDSRVAPDWLAAQLAEIAAGADAVGGRILADPTDPPALAVRRLQRRDLAHALLRVRLECAWLPDATDPWPRHHQHFGASLAVTARAYADVGGVPEVTWLEDEALVGALRRHDWPIRHSPRVRVVTSSRFDGRAEVGLAWQLRQWADPASEFHDPLVDASDAWIDRLAGLAELRRRRALHAPGDAALDARLGVPTGLSAALLADGGPFGAMRAAVEKSRSAQDAANGHRTRVPLSTTLCGLRTAVRALRRSAGSADARSVGRSGDRSVQRGQTLRRPDVNVSTNGA